MGFRTSILDLILVESYFRNWMNSRGKAHWSYSKLALTILTPSNKQNSTVARVGGSGHAGRKLHDICEDGKYVS